MSLLSLPFHHLLGINHAVLSPQEYKRVLLTGQLNVLFFISLLAFTVMDLTWGYRFPIPYNVVALLGSVVVHVLHRKGYFFSARVVLAILANGITLFFTAVLDRSMGLYQFAICINVGILVAFGYERARFALLFIALSTLLFLAALFHPLPRINRVDLADPAFLDRNLMFGFLIASAASVSVVYYLLRINYKTETDLVAKEKSISVKNDELSEVNAELDRFFYSVSHDLRSPLTSLQGLLSLLEQTKDPKEIAEYVSMLRSRVDNLDQFVRTITTYAGNARQPLQCVPVKLADLLREVLENVRFLPQAHSIDIRVEVPHQLEIVSDPTRLQIIFGNLVTNAIKYHDPAKAKPFIHIKSVLQSEALVVRIEDNGVGITEDVLPRVFEMFYRGHENSQGSGLGLYIVAEAVSKLKGTVSVKSIASQGSVFTVTLPLLCTEAADGEQAVRSS